MGAAIEGYFDHGKSQSNLTQTFIPRGCPNSLQRSSSTCLDLQTSDFEKKVGFSKHSEINDVIFIILYSCDQISEDFASWTRGES